LGIGDQGVGGILISVAKLVLYTLCAGVNPARTLPVVLDCGTNNEEFLASNLYLGIKRPRTRGAAYDEFVAKFVDAAQKAYPKAYIHFVITPVQCPDDLLIGLRKTLASRMPVEYWINTNRNWLASTMTFRGQVVSVSRQ
jgi:malic enzyme